MTSPSFQNQRATVMGLGRHGGGVGAARYLAGLGARVTITDLADESQLADSINQLAESPIERFILGRHEEQDFSSADLVVVNPAITPGNRLVELAESHGAQITTEIELFIRACPAPIIGVTGSNGKSTTATMIAEILRAAGKQCWLGGNLGGSLLGKLDKITTDDWVVLELSSFQLARFTDDTPGVRIAVVTSCTPNHLDWHSQFEDYCVAKQRILRLQRNLQPSSELSEDAHGVAVLNSDDLEVDTWGDKVVGQLAPLVDDSTIPELEVPGSHNRQNARLAATVALAAGCDERSLVQGLASFRGLPHRLQIVARTGGRVFVDDSQSTTPEATLAALEAVEAYQKPEGRIWLLAGGISKTKPRQREGAEVETDSLSEFKSLVAELTRRKSGACFFGTTGPRLYEAVQSSSGLRALESNQTEERASYGGRPAEVSHADYHLTATLSDAMDWVWEKSHPGDVIVLSPAGASFDQFRDCEHRAEHFTQLAAAIESKGTQPTLA